MKDKPGLAQTFNYLGNLALEEGQYSLAQSLYEKSLRLFGECGKRGAGPISINLATCAQLMGDPIAARSRLESAISSFMEYGDARGIAVATEYLKPLEFEMLGVLASEAH